MIRTFLINSKDEYQPGQIISTANDMPDSKATEKYKIIKLVHYDKQSNAGEFQVKPVDISKDAGNLRDANGKPRTDIR